MQIPQPMPYTFFIMNICRLKYQVKFGFLTPSFSRLSHNVLLINSSSHRFPHSLTIYSYSFFRFYVRTAVISTIFSIVQIETSTLHICNIFSFNVWSLKTVLQRLSLDRHFMFDQTDTLTLHIYNIYSFLVSFLQKCRGQSTLKYLKISRISFYSDTRNFNIFVRSNCNIDDAQPWYIFFHWSSRFTGH